MPASSKRSKISLYLGNLARNVIASVVAVSEGASLGGIFSSGVIFSNAALLETGSKSSIKGKRGWISWVPQPVTSALKAVNRYWLKYSDKVNGLPGQALPQARVQSREFGCVVVFVVLFA